MSPLVSSPPLHLEPLSVIWHLHVSSRGNRPSESATACGLSKHFIKFVSNTVTVYWWNTEWEWTGEHPSIQTQVRQNPRATGEHRQSVQPHHPQPRGLRAPAAPSRGRLRPFVPDPPGPGQLLGADSAAGLPHVHEPLAPAGRRRVCYPRATCRDHGSYCPHQPERGQLRLSPYPTPRELPLPPRAAPTSVEGDL
jgi:hypothetical protein